MSNPLHTFETPAPDFNGKTILVTGGTGSFGNSFIKAVLERYKPRKTIIFSRDEFKQSNMAAQYPTTEYPSIRFFIGDVRDSDRLEMALREVDYVVHAAALKQIPVAEYNPMECIKTNVMGAENVVQAAITAGVEKVIALSTDKAANPINLYGASKLASDKIFIAANNLSGDLGTKFSVVRYGNVIGSRGSVMPLFKKLISENAKTLPITDPRMTRFWITLEQGVNFVFSSLAMMEGGEIFVPKIPTMNIADMAKAMAPDIPHRTVGIRPGEKLHEVMIISDDARDTIEMDDRYIIQPAFQEWGPRAEYDVPTKPVPEDFSYASNTNEQQLDGEMLLELLKQQ